MAIPIQETTFDKFFSNRESLIYQFKKGDITKKEFIEEHYAFIMRLNLKAFDEVLHSISSGVLEELRREAVFSEGLRKSMIDKYVNERY